MAILNRKGLVFSEFLDGTKLIVSLLFIGTIVIALQTMGVDIFGAIGSGVSFIVNGIASAIAGGLGL
jgi:hypothetical protein